MTEAVRRRAWGEREGVNSHVTGPCCSVGGKREIHKLQIQITSTAPLAGTAPAYSRGLQLRRGDVIQNKYSLPEKESKLNSSKVGTVFNEEVVCI